MSTLIPVDQSCISATFVKPQPPSTNPTTIEITPPPSVVITVNVPLSKKPPAFSNPQLIDVSGKKVNYLTYQLVGTPLPTNKNATADLNVSATKVVQINPATGGLPALSQITVVVGSTPPSSSGISINVPLTVMPVPISGNFSSTTVTSSDPSSQTLASAYFTKGKNEVVASVRAQSLWALQKPQLVLDEDQAWGPMGGLAYMLAGTIPLDGSQVLANPQTVNFASAPLKWSKLLNGAPVGGADRAPKPPALTVDLVACTDAQPDGQIFSTVPVKIRENDAAAIPPLAPVPAPRTIPNRSS